MNFARLRRSAARIKLADFDTQVRPPTAVQRQANNSLPATAAASAGAGPTATMRGCAQNCIPVHEMWAHHKRFATSPCATAAQSLLCNCTALETLRRQLIAADVEHCTVVALVSCNMLLGWDGGRHGAVRVQAQLHLAPTLSCWPRESCMRGCGIVACCSSWISASGPWLSIWNCCVSQHKLVTCSGH